MTAKPKHRYDPTFEYYRCQFVRSYKVTKYANYLFRNTSNYARSWIAGIGDTVSLTEVFVFCQGLTSRNLVSFGSNAGTFVCISSSVSDTLFNTARCRLNSLLFWYVLPKSRSVKLDAVRMSIALELSSAMHWSSCSFVFWSPVPTSWELAIVDSARCFNSFIFDWAGFAFWSCTW